MRHLTRAFVVVMLFPAGTSAQTATVTKNAPIHLQLNPLGGLPPARVAAVGFVTVRRPELEPMDPSITPPQLPPGETRSLHEPSQPAVVPTSPRTERGWFDVDLGLAVSGADEVALDYYGLGTTFDFGGGVMIVPFLGVGVSFTGTAYLTGDDGYDDVSRTEGGVNIQAMIVPLHRENMRVRIFGGPTYFRLTDDTYYHVEGTGWGFHAGGDFSYFFTRVVGVGGFLRYTYGKVSVSDLMDDFVVGGFQTGGGLRLRF